MTQFADSRRSDSDITERPLVPASRPWCFETSTNRLAHSMCWTDVSLTVVRGETLAVLGRSGTGKSVLLKLIIGLQHPDAGSICIQGQEIAGLGLTEMNRLRIKMGFLFQHAALYDSLTVEQNVAFPLERHTKMSKSERSDRVRELLSSVGMEHDLNKMPSDISGGMQKRVGLARALALQPEILLLDEPTAGLDPITSGEIDDLVLKLQRRTRPDVHRRHARSSQREDHR